MDFNKICKKIKNLEIQGAENIAKTGVKALSLKGASVKRLLNLRPTEPCLRNALKFAKKFGSENALKHFDDSEEKIIRFGVKKIKKGMVVFTHCHSSTVVDILAGAKKQGKKFEVFNTETRPMYQGRITARELSKAGIKVTNVVDAAAGVALRKTNVMKKTDIVLLGCDAVLSNGDCVNKIGSGMFAEIAYDHKIPVYIATDSWKFSGKKVEIEKRGFEEVWNNLPKNVKVKNPAFEVIDVKFITGIISELGILKPVKFVKEVKRVYKWI